MSTKSTREERHRETEREKLWLVVVRHSLFTPQRHLVACLHIQSLVTEMQ